MDGRQESSQPDLVKAYSNQLPRSYLYFGYTTLVDLGIINHRAVDDFRNAPVHPDLYDCGDPLPLANGYPMSYAPPDARFRLFPNFIYDPKQAASIPTAFRPEDHTPAAAIARVKKAGGICVKTYFERGFGGQSNLPVLDSKTLAEIREAATREGLVLAMHANSFEAHQFGVAGKVDVLAHGMWNWGALSQEQGIPDPVKKVLDEIVEKKIGYQATMEVLPGLTAYFEPDFLDDTQMSKVVPAAMIAWFKSPDGQSFKKELSGGFTDDAFRNAIADGPMRHGRDVVAYLASHNANILFGTDTPSAPTYGNLPGLNGFREMGRMRKAGVTLEQIFQAATIGNARAFKLDSQLGTIEPGKVANLLLLRKSPLQDLLAYDSIETVWIHGRSLSRSSLAAASKR